MNIGLPATNISVDQRAMAAGRYESDVGDWSRMNCSRSPKAVFLAPALAVIGLTELRGTPVAVAENHTV